MLTDHRPFAFNCSIAIFPADEVAALAEAGGRLEALAAGEVKPADAEERHFLQVDREEAEPATMLERAWVRLKGRREYEREQAEHMPSEPAPDYGMVEFDKDRCWW